MRYLHKIQDRLEPTNKVAPITPAIEIMLKCLDFNPVFKWFCSLILFPL